MKKIKKIKKIKIKSTSKSIIQKIEIESPINIKYQNFILKINKIKNN